MPLILEGGRVPPRWASEGGRHECRPYCAMPTPHLNVALINNMPDPALEDTELQFFNLLDETSGDVPIYLKLYSLTGVPRSDHGQRHLNSFYHSLDDLWWGQFDGVIITGTEPRQPDLRDEPYWRVMSEVFDWAERNTASAILSCLAAHAAVLHSDGISRYRLPDKRFGVFDSGKACDHALFNHTVERVRFPHSRWNEVREDELTSAGYVVLTKSADAGVDTFVKKKKNSLFVYFQGHPEYGPQTLFKEYRRDIRRFLTRERETYPSMPHGYFDVSAISTLDAFQQHAMSDRREDVMAFFREDAIIDGLHNGWHSNAVRFYQNWLQYLLSRRAESRASNLTPRIGRSETPFSTHPDHA